MRNVVEQKLNILMVHNYYKQRGGEDLVFENETNLLKKNGHNVITYIRYNNEIDKTIFRKVLFPFILIFNIKTYFDITSICKKNSIDVIHVHNNMFYISQSVYYSAKKLNIPIVQSIHNFRYICPNALLFTKNSICEQCLDNGLGNAIKNNCYNKSKIITIFMVVNILFHRFTKIHNYVNYIFNTDFTRNKVLNDKSVLYNNTYILKNFTDSKVLPNNKRKRQFIYAARLDENKGIKFLLNAWKIINNAENLLIICGTGELQDWCVDFIKNNKLSNVIMKGYITHDDFLTLLSESVALIYPSIWYEVMPIGIIDSFSVGTPVIGPSFGNIDEMIISKINGYKYIMNDFESFIKAIDNVIVDKNINKKVLNHYNEVYHKSIHLTKLIEIYNSVIKR